MPLLNFALREIEDIEPWGSQSVKSLSWYGLTDGLYFIEVGGQQLFRFSQCWNKRHGPVAENFGESASPYDLFFNYQVARLHEDILDILPEVLQPVPSNLFEYVSTFDKYNQRENILEKISMSDVYLDKFDLIHEATGWTNCRCLSVAPCNGPFVMILRVDDIVRIRWDNRRFVQDGIPIWSSAIGEFSLDISEFLSEVEAFHNKLMDAMKERIERIAETPSLFESGLFDVNELIDDHEWRCGTFEKTLRNKPFVGDWGAVSVANKKLFQL